MKTSELTGNALDYAVAIANGIPADELKIPTYKGSSLFRYLRNEDGELDGSYMTGPDLLFSRKWEAGGPIIERERIRLDPREGEWQAAYWDNSLENFRTFYGNTPLIAAMRCYVASKLGDDVEIPKGLK